MTKTMRLTGIFTMATVMSVPIILAQSKTYPSLDRYMMSPDEEVALASSAAPPNVSNKATIKVLTKAGYQTRQQGSNGFVCLVMRGWVAPTYTPAPLRDLVYDADLRAPICFDSIAAQTVMPYYEFRSNLAMQGKKSPPASRLPTPRGSYPREIECRSPTCGQQTRTSDLALATGILT
jgi:hypothetical protein